MTTFHHTPLNVGDALNASTFNAIFGDLDGAIIEPGYVRVVHREAKNVGGGSLTAGVIAYRKLTEITDVVGSLVGGVILDVDVPSIRLYKGSYVIRARVPGYRVNGHRAWLARPSGEVVLMGSGGYSSATDGMTSYSLIEGVVNFSNLIGEELLIGQVVETTRLDDGGGMALNWTEPTWGGEDELYTVFEAWRMGHTGL